MKGPENIYGVVRMFWVILAHLVPFSFSFWHIFVFFSPFTLLFYPAVTVFYCWSSISLYDVSISGPLFLNRHIIMYNLHKGWREWCWMKEFALQGCRFNPGSGCQCRSFPEHETSSAMCTDGDQGARCASARQPHFCLWVSGQLWLQCISPPSACAWTGECKALWSCPLIWKSTIYQTCIPNRKCPTIR